METLIVSLSFLLVIVLGYWIAVHWGLKKTIDTRTFLDEPDRAWAGAADWTIFLFYGTTLVLWYFLFVYLFPWAWPLFVIFTSGTVVMCFDRMNEK